jgi:acetyl-CoA carboxylase carboxyltransferase component
MASVFPVVHTSVDTSSESFVQNRKDWEKVLERHEEALQWCISEGQDKYVQRHIDRGMLLCTFPVTLSRTNISARDRINLLLDPDTPFLELCIFAGYKQSGSSPSASIIAGIGIVKYIPSHPPQAQEPLSNTISIAVA